MNAVGYIVLKTSSLYRVTQHLPRQRWGRSRSRDPHGFGGYAHFKAKRADGRTVRECAILGVLAQRCALHEFLLRWVQLFNKCAPKD
jgi:hypothetical protein